MVPSTGHGGRGTAGSSELGHRAGEAGVFVVPTGQGGLCLFRYWGVIPVLNNVWDGMVSTPKGICAEEFSTVRSLSSCSVGRYLSLPSFAALPQNHQAAMCTVEPFDIFTNETSSLSQAEEGSVVSYLGSLQTHVSHSPISSCFAGRMKRFSAEDEHVTKKPTKTQSRSSPIL